MGTIFLKPPTDIEKAKILLDKLRDGQDIEVDSLNILDEILRSLTLLEQKSFRFVSTKEYSMSFKSVYDMRFKCGLSVLPKN